MTVDGKVRPEVDPFGPVEPLAGGGPPLDGQPGDAAARRAVSRALRWCSSSPTTSTPSSPWPQAEESQALSGPLRQGPGRRLQAAGLCRRLDRALSGPAGRDARQLAGPAWKKSARFIGYEAFGPPHFARWGGWKEYSSYVPGRIDWSPLVWDGGTPSFYVHNWNRSTDYTVWSPQIESMNWVFMQAAARKLRPQFWFEISTWDGNEPSQANDKHEFYAKKGQLRPGALRGGWCGSACGCCGRGRSGSSAAGPQLRSLQGPYFLAIVAAVDEVYADPVLRRFWRHGRLVPNRRQAHPYQTDVPAEYKDVDRWFLLDTSLDPPRPWKLETELPVFALALVLGERPEREWLVYAHTPLGMKRGVEVTLPDYRAVKLDVSLAGTFHHVVEKAGAVTRVGVAAAAKIAR